MSDETSRAAPATVTCSRCGEEKPRLPKPPVPGAVGREVQERVCSDCWAEWQAMEVMVINELRLNFMDPKAQQALDEQMRTFFHFDGEGGDMPVPEDV
jgi:Fe-S cluster biosynthesis and repair protein YggX